MMSAMVAVVAFAIGIGIAIGIGGGWESAAEWYRLCVRI